MNLPIIFSNIWLIAPEQVPRTQGYIFWLIVFFPANNIQFTLTLHAGKEQQKICKFTPTLWLFLGGNELIHFHDDEKVDITSVSVNYEAAARSQFALLSIKTRS